VTEKSNRMKKELRFGIWFPSMTLFPEMFHRWKLFENLGYDSVWIVDHFANPFKPETNWFDGWTLLAALAARTNKIRIGTMVTNIIYRNPALVAKQAITVDHVSGGRLSIGIGAGSSSDVSHKMTGVQAWPIPERIQRFREFVEIVDSMLKVEVTTYHGDYYKVEGAIARPVSIQRPRPPLTIAARDRRTLALAAQYGDGWNYLPRYGSEPEAALKEAGDRLKILNEIMEEMGRDPLEMNRSLFVGWTRDHPFDSQEAFYEFIGRYREIGFNEFILGYFTSEESSPDVQLQHLSDEGMLERIAREAIPKLREMQKCGR
jgi:alkanesulfonate monooxygenase SsuD/methylene tetrahydromethanopterin reductase-like flavin-dependent oxidoreductase (luciferase family)